MKRIVLAALLVVSLSTPARAAGHSAPFRTARVAASWIVRTWHGIVDAIGRIHLFDGDGGGHTLPPPPSMLPSSGN